VKSAWSKDELCKIAQTHDLDISAFREDGKTYGTPTWIWSVVFDDALYMPKEPRLTTSSTYLSLNINSTTCPPFGAHPAK
jgi:hypothetical protein